MTVLLMRLDSKSALVCCYCCRRPFCGWLWSCEVNCRSRRSCEVNLRSRRSCEVDLCSRRSCEIDRHLLRSSRVDLRSLWLFCLSGLLQLQSRMNHQCSDFRVPILVTKRLDWVPSVWLVMSGRLFSRRRTIEINTSLESS